MNTQTLQVAPCYFAHCLRCFNQFKGFKGVQKENIRLSLLWTFQHYLDHLVGDIEREMERVIDVDVVD